MYMYMYIDSNRVNLSRTKGSARISRLEFSTVWFLLCELTVACIWWRSGADSGNADGGITCDSLCTYAT